jgi:hypothetical protein
MENNLTEKQTSYIKEINDYILEKIIGRGTYGLVYQARFKINKFSKQNKDNLIETFAIKKYFKNLNPNYMLLEISIIRYLK